MKKLEKKTVAEARREKAAKAANDLVAEESEKEKKSQLNSPKTAKGGKLKKVDLSTKSEEIPNLFQNRDSAAEE